MTQDEVFDYIDLYGKIPHGVRFRFNNWGLGNGRKEQYVSGTISFWLDGKPSSVIRVSSIAEKSRFMERKTKESKNLDKEKYFIWQPDFYDKP